MTKIILYLRDDEVAQLRGAATRDYRDLTNQARYILREALAGMRISPDNGGRHDEAQTT